MNNKNISKIAYTALLIALLLVLQTVTKPYGQIVTGSCVNMILAVTAFCITLRSSIIISVISPFLAFFLGIGPVFLPITPAIAVSNVIYVILIYILDKNLKITTTFVKNIISIIVASIFKFLSLYLIVVKFICVIFTSSLKPQQIKTFSVMFSIPQLITAIVGGALAILISKIIKNVTNTK